MKYKLIVLLILIFSLSISQTPVFKSPYLTDEMRSSTKKLLKFDEVVKNISDDDRIEKLKKQVKFYRAVSEAIYIEYNKLNKKNAEKFEKFETLINQYKDIVGNDVNSIDLADPPEITYEYKPMKITSTAVKKQNHKKQAKLMKKNYILMFKYYKESTGVYTEYLQYLKEIKESGQYKIKENLISDSVTSDSNIVKSSSNNTTSDIDDEQSKMDNIKEQVEILSKTEEDIVEESTPKITTSSVPQVSVEELEKVNEELSYRIQSLEVRIDEIQEEENKKSDGIEKQVKKIESKIKKLEKNDEDVKVVIEDFKKVSNDYSNRDYPDAFIDAKNNGLTKFTYRGKTIYAFTRKEYKEAMTDARIYGKEQFELGNKVYKSKLEYEQIERLKK